MEQDTQAAQYWLEKAVSGDDVHAMKSLALMHLSNMTEVTDTIGEAANLLEACSTLDAEQCLNEMTALNKFIAARDE